MANNGPTFTKATYDKKLPRPDAPSPARQQAEREQQARDAAKERAFHKKANEVGLGHALFPDVFPPKETIKRRI